MDLLASLRVFIRVVEVGSFSAVAREISTNHSSVTRQISQLEAHFGARLFQRTTRRLSLTADGTILVDHARRLLEDARAMESQLGAQRVSPTGLVRVGLPVSAGLYIATRLPVLLREYPGLSVELLVDDQIREVVEAQIDVAVRVGRIDDSSLMARRLGTVQYLFVASPAYLARAGIPAVPEDLSLHECVVHGPSATRMTWVFGTSAAPRPVRIRGSLIVNESEVARRAAVAGHGIARLTGINVIDDIQTGRLVRLLVHFPMEPLPVHLVYPTRRHLAPRTRLVMDFMAEQMTGALAALADIPAPGLAPA